MVRVGKQVTTSTQQDSASIRANLGATVAARWRTPLSFAILLLTWEILVRLLGIKLYILPPPSSVFMTLWTKRATIGAAAWYTAQPMLIGFGFAVLIGVALALSFAFSRRLEAIVYPQIVFLQIIPKIAVAPLFMIWFGYGLTLEGADRLPAFVLSVVVLRRSRHSARSIPISWTSPASPAPVRCGCSARSRCRTLCR